MLIEKYIYIILILSFFGLADLGMCNNNQETTTLSVDIFAVRTGSEIDEYDTISHVLRNETIIIINKLSNYNKNNLQDIIITFKIPSIYDEINLLDNNWILESNPYVGSDNYTYMSCKIKKLDGRISGENNHSQLFKYSVRIKKNFEEGTYPLPSIIDMKQNDRSGKAVLDSRNSFKIINTYCINVENNKPNIKYFFVFPENDALQVDSEYILNRGQNVTIDFSISDEDDDVKELTCYLYDILISNNNYTSDPINIFPGVSNYTLNVPGKHIFKIIVKDEYSNDTKTNETIFNVSEYNYKEQLKYNYKNKAKIGLVISHTFILFILLIYFNITSFIRNEKRKEKEIVILFFAFVFFIILFLVIDALDNIHAFQIIVFVAFALISAKLFHEIKQSLRFFILILLICFFILFYYLPDLYATTKIPSIIPYVADSPAMLITVIPLILVISFLGLKPKRKHNPLIHSIRKALIKITPFYLILIISSLVFQPTIGFDYEFGFIEMIVIISSQIMVYLSLTYAFVADG